MLLKQTRIHPMGDCRIGVLEDGRGFQLFTLEPPATGDPHCVPDGEYELIPYRSPEHGATWCLHNPKLGVYAGAKAGHPKPNRTKPLLLAIAKRLGRTGDYLAHRFKLHLFDYVEFHVGNWPHDSRGCTLVGLDWRGDSMIYRSAEAMARLRAHLGLMSRGHRLIISHRND